MYNQILEAIYQMLMSGFRYSNRCPKIINCESKLGLTHSLFLLDLYVAAK